MIYGVFAYGVSVDAQEVNIQLIQYTWDSISGDKEGLCPIRLIHHGNDCEEAFLALTTSIGYIDVGVCAKVNPYMNSHNFNPRQLQDYMKLLAALKLETVLSNNPEWCVMIYVK